MLRGSSASEGGPTPHLGMCDEKGGAFQVNSFEEGALQIQCLKATSNQISTAQFDNITLTTQLTY